MSTQTACPKCATQLKDDYGMVTCPGCGSIVFVDMEGVAQVASETPVAEEARSFGASEPAEIEVTPMDPFNVPMQSSPADFPAIDSPMAALEDPPVEPQPMVPDTSEVDMNAFLGYEPEGGAAAIQAPPAQAMSQNDPKDPLGLSAYANSEMSSAKNGPLVVTLIISGIDAKDLRAEIRQALQDSRFGWDTAALMSSIKGGILRIEQVSPVKATIIINRIKNLSVRIRWEQSAITEIDPISKE